MKNATFPSWFSSFQIEFFTILFILFTLLILFVLRKLSENSSLKKQIKLLKKEKEEFAFKMQIQEKMLLLQSRQSSVGELVGNISHQWKEPLGGLGAILANLQATLIIKGEVSNDKLIDAIEKSYKIMSHLTDTIDVFYRFFRHSKSDKSEFNLFKEIQNIQKMVNYSMQTGQIILKVDCDKDIYVYGDRSEFVNALLNILLNAKDILMERKIQEPAIQLKVFKQDANITITIEDNGGGVQQEPIEKIFEYAISSKEESTGIGLFIVKNIIEQRMRGKIKVQNTQKGALFNISLPLTLDVTPSDQSMVYEVEESAYERIIRLEKEVAKQSEVEKALRQWEDIFNQTHWGVVVHKGRSNHFEMVNPAFCQMYGYDKEELKNMTVFELFSKESLEILKQKQKEAFEKSFISFEAIHLRKDGTKFPVNIDLTVIKNEYDEILYRIANVRDITKKKQAEQNLLLKEFALNKINEAVFLIDENSKFQYVNESACKSLGYSEKELLTMKVSDIDSNILLERFEDLWIEMKKQKTISLETHHIRKDGTTFPVEINSNYCEYQNISYNLATVRNISERKEIEKRKEDEKMCLFFERQIIGMAITSPKEGWVQTNDKLCEILGYSHQELSQISWVEMTHPEDRERDLELFNKILSGNIDDYTLEKRVIRKDKEMIYINLAVSCVRHQDGDINYILALIEDITKRKLVEKELADSYDFLNHLVDSIPDPIFVKDRNHRWLILNKANCELTGLSKNFLIGKSDYDIFPKEEADIFWEKDEIVFQSKKVNINEEFFTSLDGVVHCIETVKSMVVSSDGEEYLVGTIRDITERRNAENAVRALNDTLEQKVKERTFELQQALEFNEGIINAIPDLMFEVDKEGTYLNVWAKNGKLLAAQKEVLLGNKISNILSPKSTKVAMEAIQEADEKGLSFGKVLQIDLPDGVHWFELSSSKKADGNFIFISRDVTERKIAQIKIEEESEKFSSIFRLSPAGISISSLDQMVYVDVNDSLLNYIGYTREEMIGRGTEELGIFQDSCERLELLNRLQKDGAVSGFEYSYRTKNGDIGQSMMYGTIIMLNGEKCFLAHNYDITERKKIETRFSKIAVAAPGVNYIFEKTVEGEFRFTYLAPTFEELSGVSNEVVLNDFTKSFEMIVPQDRERVMESIILSAENLTILHMEFRIMHPQKGILWVESQSKPEKLPNGTIEWYGFLYYITNRKNDEQNLGLLNKAIDNTSDAVYILKDDHSIYYASDGACRMLGYTKEEFFTMKIEDIDPLISTEEISIVRDEVKKKQKSIFQTKHRKKNGAIIDVEITSTEFIYDDDLLSLAIVKDITQEIRYEEEIKELNRTLEHKVMMRTEELQKAVEFNKSIIQAIPDMLFEISKEGVYLNIWARDEKLLAQQKEILLGKNFQDMLPQDAVEISCKTIEEVDRYGSSLGNTYKLDLPDGEHWFELHTTKKEPEDTYLALVRDITERKKAQNALVELNATLEEKVKERTSDLRRAFELNEEIINTLPDLLFEMDKNGNYLNIWAQNKELLAQQKEVLLGNNISNVLSKESADTIMEAFREADLKKVSIGKTIIIDLPDGKKEFELSVSKKSDGNFLVLSRELLGR